MKPCPNCKQELSEGTVFCPHCGFRVRVPQTDGKLLTGSPAGDVILGLVLHVVLLTALNAVVRALDARTVNDYGFFYTPAFSLLLYLVVGVKLKYRSLGAGIWWTYLISLIAGVAFFVLCFGLCLIGGIASKH